MAVVIIIVSLNTCTESNWKNLKLQHLMDNIYFSWKRKNFIKSYINRCGVYIQVLPNDDYFYVQTEFFTRQMTCFVTVEYRIQKVSF